MDKQLRDKQFKKFALHLDFKTFFL